ncbi:MAG: ImmA/IrrE family metallo-endopeptidase [Chloroflexi bacterium]|nr:ImmA/IrrE family metallo-endopeptidase [Chloroflexota bacterium]
MSVSFSFGDGTSGQKPQVSLNMEQAMTLIVERAKQLVNRVIENRGHDSPPFLPEEFVRLQGIKKIEKADLGETSAVLLRFHDGYMIRVNQKQSSVRQNFSCAHEIGHILFNELTLEPYIQSIEYRTFNPKIRIYESSTWREREARAAARERFCDVAAAELLMPESVFSKYLLDSGVSISSIEQLAKIFRVSIPSTAIRIAEICPEPCLALLWQSRPKNEPKGLRLAWSIGPGRKPRGKVTYVPAHTFVNHTSNLYKAYQGDSPIKSWKKISGDRRLTMESKGFGHGERRYVISLAFLNR